MEAVGTAVTVIPGASGLQVVRAARSASAAPVWSGAGRWSAAARGWSGRAGQARGVVAAWREGGVGRPVVIGGGRPAQWAELLVVGAGWRVGPACKQGGWSADRDDTPCARQSRGWRGVVVKGWLADPMFRLRRWTGGGGGGGGGVPPSRPIALAVGTAGSNSCPRRRRGRVAAPRRQVPTRYRKETRPPRGSGRRRSSPGARPRAGPGLSPSSRR